MLNIFSFIVVLEDINYVKFSLIVNLEREKKKYINTSLINVVI